MGSLFSGCGGMDLGFERAGFDVRWHAEIDKDAVSVLARHWPDVPQLGSVTDIDGAQIEPVDVIIGGFPCQDVSLAGKRKGMAGARSGLFYEFLRIVEEMREATDGRYPAVAVFENVYGLLSSHRGRDFAAVLAGLRNSGAAVAFRVLDAQFFGVPQRRRRVFIVADFAPVGVGERRAAQVLALGESLCGHPAAGGESGQGSHAATESGAGVGREPLAVSKNERAETRLTPYVYALTGGGGKPGQGYGAVLQPLPPAVIGTITANYGNQNGQDAHANLIAEPVAAFGGNRTSGPIDVAACLSTSNQRLDFETQTLIVSSDVASSITASAGHHGQRGDGSDNLVAIRTEQTYAEAETRSGEVLRRMRAAFGEEAFQEWGLGVLAALRSQEVLQPGLHVEELRCPPESDHGVVNDALPLAEDAPAGAVRRLLEAVRPGCPPHRPGLHEQLHRELGEALSRLPCEKAQAQALMLALRAAGEGLRVLRHALPAVQAVGRPEQDRDTGAEALRGLGLSDACECSRVVRSPLHAAQTGGNARVVNPITLKEGGAWVVRRLTPL